MKIMTSDWLKQVSTYVTSAKTFAVTNPADGSHIAHVADMGAEETHAAIAAA